MNATLVLSTATISLMMLCIMFAGFLWTVDSKNRLSNRLLSLNLVVLAISISAFWYGFYYDFHLGWDRLRDDINILASPLLFMFTVAALHRDFKLKWKHLAHLIPLLLITLLITPRFYMADNSAKIDFLNHYYDQPEVRLSNLIRFATPVIYYIWTYVKLFGAKQLILENHSDDKIKLYQWLWQLNSLSVFIFLVSLTKGALRFQVTSDTFQFVRLAMVMTLISFLVWLVMKALHHPNLFRGLEGSLQPISKILEDQEHQHSPIGTNFHKEEIDRIRVFMKSEKPYLDPSLSLQKLARQLSTPPHDLSLLINHQIGQHFFDFINEYRIRQAQSILIDPAQRAKTILEIMYEVGFNSKSSFNTAFKKHTDLTPSAYRKKFS